MIRTLFSNPNEKEIYVPLQFIIGDMTEDEEYLIEKENREKATLLITDKILNSLKKITLKVINTNENFVFSPVAFYLDLIILAKITGSNTKEQVLKVMGISECDLPSIYEALECVSSSYEIDAISNISSSLWLNDEICYNEEYIKEISEKLHLASYSGTMGAEEMDTMITKWINNSTGNLLSDSVQVNTTKDTLLELLTAIYFKASWTNTFNEECTHTRNFYVNKTTTVQCDFMYQQFTALYHKGNNFTALTMSLVNDYDAIFILPNEKVSISEVIGWYDLITTGKLSTTMVRDVDFFMPKYDISTTLNACEVMKELGIENAFNPKLADYTPIRNIRDVYLSKAQQTTRFKVNEDGIEATSYLKLDVISLSLPEEIITFSLNRPFIFALVSKEILPIFVGKVENPCKN